MPEDRVHPLASAPSLAADQVTRRSFASAFRGYDQAEVRAFLGQVAEELRVFARREEDLIRQLRDARERATHPRVDEETLTEALGHEAARLLHTAHDAAADIRRKAEENAAKVLRDAHEEASRIRGAAETVMGERTSEAEVAAAEIRDKALAESRSVVSTARSEADELMESARAHADAIGQEAGELRARLLGELMRRRRIMHAQVEQLGAGRESLLGAVTGVRRLIEEAEAALVRVETEAKAEAEGAFRRAMDEPEPPELAQLAASPPAPAPPAAGRTPGPPAEPAAAEPAPPAPGPAERAGAAEKPAQAEPPDTEPAGVEPARPAPRPRPMAIVPPPVAAATPPPPTETEPDEDAPIEERRGSSLRILRWGGRSEKTEGRRGTSAGRRSAEVDEGVRIIRPAWQTAGEEAPAPPDEAPAGTEEPAGREPAATVAVEPAIPSESAVAAEPAAQAADEAKGEGPSVDALFARIRAEREAAKQKAEEVLEERAAENADEEQPEASAPAEPDAETAETGASDGEHPADAEEPVGEDVEDDVEVRALTRRNELLGPINERLARKLKRALQDDQNDVLDRLRGSSRGRQGPVLPDEEEHLARYSRAAEPLVGQAFTAGCGFAAEVFPGATPGEPKDLPDMTRELARSVVGPLRQKLNDCLEDSQRDEASAADAIGAAYRGWKGERVESLAMDHALGAFERAVLACLPDGATVRWVVDDDGGPCPDCDDNGLAGATAAGEGFPTGQAHPPAHPGCRCLLAPLPA